MAERSKAAVLKTVDVKASWGSNPYLPATFYHLKLSNVFRLFLFDFKRNSRCNSSLGILKFHIEIPQGGWGMTEREIPKGEF